MSCDTFSDFRQINSSQLGLEGLISEEPAIPLEAVVDARGLFDALTAPNLGKLSDRSTV